MKKSWFFYFGVFSSLFFASILFFSFSKLSSLLKVQKFHFSFNKMDDYDTSFFSLTNQLQLSEKKKLLKSDLTKRLQKFLGRYIWQISFSQTLKTLKENPWVKNAYMVRKFPSYFHIILQMYTPIFVLIDDDGAFLLVNEGGSFLPHSQFWDLPIVRGSVFVEKFSLRQQAVRLMLDLPSQGLFSPSWISDIWYDREQGFILFLSSLNIEVKLGEDHFYDRARRVEQVLEYLKSHGKKGRVIDARFSKKVVVSLNNPA